MMGAVLAVEWGHAALSFTTGLLAAINPCGFVLLPAYLTYFLGMEAGRGGDQRASIGRALQVGAAVSGGFVVLFLVIGSITRWKSKWFYEHAPWISLVIAGLLVILGVAMVFGYRLPLTTPKLQLGRRDRSVRSMFVFGLAYGIASIGCTLGPFMTNVLAGINREGFVAGISYFVMYAAAMALVVIGLTVSIAAANRWLVTVLRRGMQHVETVAGVVVLLSGLYLFWYWYNDLRDNLDDSVTSKALGWQNRLQNFVDRNQAAVVTVLAAVVVAAIAVTVLRQRRHSTPG